MKIVLRLIFFICALTSMNAQIPYKVKEINPGMEHSYVQEMTDVNGILYFTANINGGGVQLWRSDGSEAGTKVLITTNLDFGLSDLININGTLFFKESSYSEKFRLWKSDGTTEGTVLVKNMDSLGFSKLINVTGIGYFFSFGKEYGTELWKTDGTETGTIMVKDITPGPKGTSFVYLVAVNGTAFFTITNLDSGGYELWKSDGTESGTLKLKTFENWEKPTDLTNVNGTLFFGLYTGVYDYYLFKSDGTPEGTVIVKNFPLGIKSLQNLTNVNGTLYFAVNEANLGIELWKSDGTAAGTQLVKDIFPGIMPSNPTDFTPLNNRLFFKATADTINKSVLWMSDGTETGTNLVKVIYPEKTTVTINFFTACNSEIFFRINDYKLNTSELWRSDGSESGTQKIPFEQPFSYELVCSGKRLFFTSSSKKSAELWALQDATSIDYANSESLKDEIEISPNPFDGSTTVTINADISDDAELVLYDMLGSEVRRFTVSTPSFKIERGELADGIYTLQWLNGNNTISQRLVIMR